MEVSAAVVVTPTVLWEIFKRISHERGLQAIPFSVNQTTTVKDGRPMVGAEVIAARGEFEILRVLCNIAGLWFTDPSWKPFGIKFLYTFVIVENWKNPINEE